MIYLAMTVVVTILLLMPKKGVSPVLIKVRATERTFKKPGSSN